MKLHRSVAQPLHTSKYPTVWRNIDKIKGEMTWEGW